MFAIIVSVLCVLSLYIWCKQKLSVWSKQSVPNSSHSIFQIVKLPFLQLDSELVAQHGKVVGLINFFRPTLLIADLELTKSILNDLEHFPNRIKFGAEKNISGENILFARDSKWRRLRHIVTPSFSPNKLRRMLPLMESCVHDLIDALESGEPIVDVKPYFSGFTLDTIAKCAFGIQLNSAKDPNNEFVKYGQKFFGSLQLNTLLVILFPTFSTEVLNLHGFNREATRFFFNLTLQIIEDRRQSKADNDYNDFIGLLMKAEFEGQLLTDKQIADQGIAFFLAGFDTSSVTLTTIAYLLAKHQPVQDQLKTEIDQFFKENKSVSYDTINELNYLDAVINETLRYSPTLPRLMREADKDYTIEYNGKEIFIPKDTHIQMSVHCIHHDEENFEDATHFRPERFLKNSILKHNTNAFLPFGNGPRNCVGVRLAMLEIKVCVLHLIRRFQFEMVDKTEPLKYAPAQPVSSTETMYLKLVKRQL
ncbi:cytochrome P450 3A2-like [Bradysia coprophila]|uniref:cytochrome P450 3A2-like n=1 Tax=Bradysia coprophila TaxID=38358 RepID=UPI00187DD872|nr:cytochrome P450 3A2-like [Bradysia coprophila]